MNGVVTRQCNAAIRQRLCAGGVSDNRCAGALWAKVGLCHALEVIQCGVDDAGAEVFSVFIGAAKKSFVEVPLCLTRGGSRFVQPRNDAEDRLFQCERVMPVLQKPTHRGVEVGQGVD